MIRKAFAMWTRHSVLLLICFVGLPVLALDTQIPKSYSSVVTGSDADAKPKSTDASASISSATSPQSPYLAALQRSASDPGPNPFRQYNGNNPGNSNNKDDRRGNSLKESCRASYNFDYIQLTLQWGPGYCATSPSQCLKVEPRFTIHGLWAQNKVGDAPAFCCSDSSFNVKSLGPIMSDLDLHWFSYFNSNSRSFWQHEWRKHGTCTRDVPELKGQYRYFSTTLDLLKKLPILETLKKENITPSRRQAYTYPQINAALKRLTGGKDVKVECDLEHNQPIPILTGVNFCFDSKLNFINCPWVKRRCKNQLYLLNE